MPRKWRPLSELVSQADLCDELRRLLDGRQTPSARWSPLATALRELLVPQSRHSVLYSALLHVGRNRVVGDYAEFGVWKGITFMDAYFAAERLRAMLPSLPPSWRQALPGRFVAFDSFQGMPSPGAHDNVGLERGDLAVSRRKFEQHLDWNGVDLSRVEIVEGFFRDTLQRTTKARIDLRAVSVAVVDCDFYESARQVFDFLTDLLVDGSVLIIDDWYLGNARPDRAVRRAFDDWRRAQSHLSFVPFLSSGWSNSFVVNRSQTVG